MDALSFQRDVAVHFENRSNINNIFILINSRCLPVIVAVTDAHVLDEHCSLPLSSLLSQIKTLLRFIQSMPSVSSADEVQLLLEPLFRDKSAGVSSLSSQAWQEIVSVATLFKEFGAKEQVLRAVWA